MNCKLQVFQFWFGLLNNLMRNPVNCQNLQFFEFLPLFQKLVKSIIIPDNIKKIGSSCFPKCLINIDFENGAPKLERISNNAFSQTQIETFKFPSNFKIFVQPKNVFLQCKRLKTLIFDSYVNKNQPSEIENDVEIYEKERRIKKKVKFNEEMIKLADSSEKV